MMIWVVHWLIRGLLGGVCVPLPWRRLRYVLTTGSLTLCVSTSVIQFWGALRASILFNSSSLLRSLCSPCAGGDGDVCEH